MSEYTPEEYTDITEHEKRVREIEVLTRAIMSNGEAFHNDEDGMLVTSWHDVNTSCSVELEQAAYCEEGNVYYLTTYNVTTGDAIERFRFDDETYEAVQIDENERETYDDFVKNLSDATMLVHAYLKRSLPDIDKILGDASYEESFWPIAAAYTLSNQAAAWQIIDATYDSSTLDQSLIESVTSQHLSVDTTSRADDLDKKELFDVLKIPEPERTIALDGLAQSILSRGFDIKDPELVTDAIIDLMDNDYYLHTYGGLDSTNGTF